MTHPESMPRASAQEVPVSADPTPPSVPVEPPAPPRWGAVAPPPPPVLSTVAPIDGAASRGRPSKHAAFPAHERDARRQRAEQLLLEGLSAATILRRVVNEFGCSPRTVKLDLAKVQRRWSLAGDRRLRRARLRVVAQLQHATASAMREGDHRSAMAGYALQAKLLGLLGPDVLVASATTLHVGAPLPQVARELDRVLREQFGDGVLPQAPAPLGAPRLAKGNSLEVAPELDGKGGAA